MNDLVFLETLDCGNDRFIIQNIHNGPLKHVARFCIAVIIFATIRHVAVAEDGEMIGQGTAISNLGRDDAVADKSVAPGVEDISLEENIRRDIHNVPFERG